MLIKRRKRLARVLLVALVATLVGQVIFFVRREDEVARQKVASTLNQMAVLEGQVRERVLTGRHYLNDEGNTPGLEWIRLEDLTRALAASQDFLPADSRAAFKYQVEVCQEVLAAEDAVFARVEEAKGRAGSASGMILRDTLPQYREGSEYSAVLAKLEAAGAPLAQEASSGASASTREARGKFLEATRQVDQAATELQASAFPAELRRLREIFDAGVRDALEAGRRAQMVLGLVAFCLTGTLGLLLFLPVGEEFQPGSDSARVVGKSARPDGENARLGGGEARPGGEGVSLEGERARVGSADARALGDQSVVARKDEPLPAVSEPPVVVPPELPLEKVRDWWRRHWSLAFEPIFLVDTNGGILELNPAAERLFELGASESRGKDLLELIFSDEEEEAWRQRLEEQARAGAYRSEEPVRARLKLRNGSRFPADLAFAVLEVRNERVLTVFVRDVRDQVSVEELKVKVRTNTSRLERSAFELKISEARKSAILEAAIDSIIGLDEQWRIVELNPATEKTFGLSRDEALGMNFTNLILTKSPAAMMEGEAEKIVERLPFSLGRRVEVSALRADGATFPAEVTVVRVAVGGTHLYTVYLSDITERKRVERLKNEFISIVSHELRTPLTSIRGSLGLLEGGVAGSLEASALELIRIARANSDRLIRLVNDMLDLEKMGAGKVELKVERLSAEDLVLAACAGVEGMASEAGVVITHTIVDRATVSGDRDRLIQVLTNLLSNAIKFSGEGSRVQVEVSLRDERVVRLAVHDEGPGIAEEQIPKLFNRFQQLQAAGAKPRSGSGLGLAISKAIVELHRGRIGVESTLGEGATFYFDLPLESAS